MDIYKLKWTRLQVEIFRFLCIIAGKSATGREIAKKLKKSPTAVSKSLKDLEKEEIISVNRDKENAFSIELDLDNEAVISLKRVENLKMLYESGLAHFLRDKFPGCTAILFGSYSRGEDIHSSDIDIAIVGTKDKEINLKEYEKMLGKNIIVNFYVSFREINKHLRNNMLNGIILSGSVSI